MYANDHKGFSIEYDGGHPLMKDLAAAKWLFPVSYQADRPTTRIADFDDWTQGKNLQVLRQWAETKCKKAWGEEMEWRFICPLTPDPQRRVEISSMDQAGRLLYFFHIWRSSELPENRVNSTVIKRVILGVRAPEDLENAIRKALREPYLKHVGLYRAKLCDRHFALRIECV